MVNNTYFSNPPSSSFLKLGSVHVENFSKMYAANPTGESYKPQPRKKEKVASFNLDNSQMLLL